MLDYGIFYEFIPLNNTDKIIPLGEVELGINYAIVITTNSGLWRYKIGDTIKFTSLNPYRIKVTGRTKHFINAFGEELIVENAEVALAKAAEKNNCKIKDYTAAPVYMSSKKSGGHEWLIEFSEEPKDLDKFTKTLDENLKKINSDYEAKRYKDSTMKIPKVIKARPGLFYDWLSSKKKLGGQNKIPRLSNSRDYIEELKSLN